MDQPNQSSNFSSNISSVSSSHELPFRFTGKGLEYFGIWIVNLLLSIITLGIYSAWAKVRRNQYFYGNTQVAGASFEYHGNPIAILKGRIVAVLLIGGYQLAFKFSALAGFITLGALMLVFPWLIWKSLQFKTYNTSYRGIRFGFRGSVRQAYTTYLFYPLLAGLSFYLLLPLAHQRMKQFQHSESRFGSSFFSFHAKAGAFYVAYLIGLAIAIAGFIGIGIAFASVVGTFFGHLKTKTADPGSFAAMVYVLFAIYAWLFLLVPIFLTMIQNLIWNNTRLEQHQFRSNMKWGKMTFITITNLIAIVFTLGLFTPFAKIRSLRYRIESMTLIPQGSLDHFIADHQAKAGAVGEGMGDLLDFDLSL